MHILGISIRNFRNFADLTVSGLQPGTVVVGRNNIGKSNLLHALRLVLDSSLPDSARVLQADDFWDAGPAFRGVEVHIDVDLTGFDGDDSAEAVLADYIVQRDPFVARLSYSFHPRATVATDQPEALRSGDYEYTVTGGPRGVRVTNDVRRMVSLRVMPALRDAEGDLQVWARSPLRSLLEQLSVPDATLEAVAREIDDSSKTLLDDPAIADLDSRIRQGLIDLVGPTFAIPTQLGIATNDPDLVIRAIRLLVEGGRGVGRTGLGAANVLFLALLLEDLRRREAADQIATWILAVEEPEAHLHPHIQREVFRTLLRSERGLVLTTHSPQVVSVSPVNSILLLREGTAGTVGFYSGNAGLTRAESADLERYLDAVRADFMFARGVLLVEGAAELWLVPAAAEALGQPLDRLGVSVCPVHGVSFAPYRKLLGPSGLDIPHAIITDGDPAVHDADVTGLQRGIGLLDLDQRADASGELNAGLMANLRQRLERSMIFVGAVSLEADVALADPAVVTTAFRELVAGRVARRRFGELVETMTNDPSPDNQRLVVGAIDRLGKGRFAQELAKHLRPESVPAYVRDAINAIVASVR